VLESVREHSTNFSQMVVLGAEISWKGLKPQIARAHIDFATLQQEHSPIGVGLRIGAFQGQFAETNGPAMTIVAAAKALLQECASNQVSVAELQIDFDCAASKLAGYELWLKRLRQEIAPLPMVFTALPSWLSRKSDFGRLVDACDGFVLQVHSLERPKDADAPFTLCDPKAARRAVERAAAFGKRFRVALPTYGYTVAFDAKKRFIGLSAEGPERLWPEGTLTREVRAQPDAIARLVHDWIQEHPAALAGIIWYRMPVSGDSLNWSWPTLAAVMKGNLPQEHVAIETARPARGLVEVTLTNDGETSIYFLPAVELVGQKGV
jgi:hypothetical protein